MQKTASFSLTLLFALAMSGCASVSPAPVVKVSPMECPRLAPIPPELARELPEDLGNRTRELLYESPTKATLGQGS